MEWKWLFKKKSAGLDSKGTASKCTTYPSVIIIIIIIIIAVIIIITIIIISNTFISTCWMLTPRQCPAANKEIAKLNTTFCKKSILTEKRY